MGFFIKLSVLSLLGDLINTPILQLSVPLSNHSMVGAQMSQRFMVHFVFLWMLIHSEITQKKYTKERRGRDI